MLANWSKARRASLAAASLAAMGTLAASPALALEGIQGRHAIFYPSLELVYQHDDNFYLTPNDEIGAESVTAHANFTVEVPGVRQYLKLSYSPQWRDVSVSKGPEPILTDTAHFWDLLAKLQGTSVFGVDIAHHFYMGSLETGEVDPNREFVNKASDEFSRNDIDLDFRFMGSRQGAIISLGKEDTNFDGDGGRTAWFETDGWDLGVEYRWKFAPLSHFMVEYQHDDATQDYTEAYFRQNGLLRSLDSNSDRINFGFDGELGRTTTGRAVLGFRSMNFDDNLGRTKDWDGITLRADVTKSFSRFTKLSFNAERTPNYSGFGERNRADDYNAYYLSNRASVTLTGQPMGGKVFWTMMGQFQRNGYDTPTRVDPADPRPVPLEKEREDDIARLRAEIGFHPLQHLSFRVNYQWEERDSNIYRYDYTDNIVLIQMNVGF